MLWRQRLSVTLNNTLAFSVKDRQGSFGGQLPMADRAAGVDYRVLDYVRYGALNPEGLSVALRVVRAGWR